MDWQKPQKVLVDQCNEKEREEFTACYSLGALQSRLEPLRKERQCLNQGYSWERLQAFIKLLKPIAEVADTIAPSALLPSSSIWGVFVLLVDVCPPCPFSNRVAPSADRFSDPPFFYLFIYIFYLTISDNR